MKVLLTDGNFKHTLAAVRALGKRGIEVTVLSHIRVSVSFGSRYCAHIAIAPDPQRDPDGFSRFLLAYVREHDFNVLLPISFAAVMQVAKIRRELEQYVKIPLAGEDSLAIAGSKDETLRFAEKIGLAIPRTWYPRQETDVRALAGQITYPAVIKGSEESGFVRYANSPDELVEKYRMIADYSPVIQEYITGKGYGFFALYCQGRPRAIFMHERVREYPVTGGPSAVAMSIFDPALRTAGEKILTSLNWHGVAMVEFKKDDRTGEYVLMEINPKFWGSLDLSIASGVDFPYLACRMAAEGDVSPVTEYETGVKFRWLFPADLFYLMTNPRDIASFVKDFADRRIRYNIELSDPLPTFLEMGMTVAEFFLRIKQRRFWRPHGQPHR
jgi:predicted ATP-grasp superfamily ATP-dependent carboligase